MQNDPDEPTKPMGDGSHGLIVSEARHQSPIDNLENSSFRLGGSIGSLIENAPHLAVTFRGAVALGVPRSRRLLGMLLPRKKAALLRETSPPAHRSQQ